MNLLTSWDDAFNVVIDIFMKIMDWMWTLKLPATDIPLYVLWIIGGILGIVMRLVGSAPQLSTMSQNTASAMSTGLGAIRLKENKQIKHIKANKGEK
ncbi:hypothetical protein QII16_gp09 [Spiroplasma phage SVGII3]|uniref:Spiroplasmavirus-related protein n=2 Tax=root TaxID=1 RepID=Q3ZVE9_9VIRU|nr:hypothetical protein QII16_gp09 [Spiroplasma phage SVGII3]CAI94594.1 hypothetical protein [Spiroplasma phage SVGII3]CAK99949.1 probable plectrovirus svts2 orf5 transmembrane protein [Spiroplasma citri]